MASLEDARRQLLADARRTLTAIERVLGEHPESIDETIEALCTVQQHAHDALRRVEHGQMVLAAAQWLARHGGDASLRWLCNWRQPGDHAGPDLVGLHGDVAQVCAEVNALDEPVGVVDSQIRRSLARLAALDGRRFYFVRTASMKRRVVTKVVKAGWEIAVVQVSLQHDLPALLQNAPAASLAEVRLSAR